MLCRVLRLKTKRPQKYPYACHTTSWLRDFYYINGRDSAGILLSAAEWSSIDVKGRKNGRAFAGKAGIQNVFLNPERLAGSRGRYQGAFHTDSWKIHMRILQIISEMNRATSRFEHWRYVFRNFSCFEWWVSDAFTEHGFRNWPQNAFFRSFQMHWAALRRR